MRVTTPTPAWRAMVAWRAALATLGAYVLAGLVCVGLSVGLPRLGVARVEAVVGATLLVLIALPLAPVFIFAGRSTRRVTLLLAGCLVAAGLLCWILQGHR